MIKIKLQSFAEEKIHSALNNLILIAEERNLVPNKKILRTTHSTSPSKQRDWYDKVISDTSCRYFFIKDIKKDICYGYCGLDKIDFINRSAEISIMIFSKYQQHGIGKKAVIELIYFGMLDLGLNCLFAESYLYPEREEFIGKFWKDMGFKLEGILRKRKYWKGHYYDSGIFSIIKGDAK